MLKFGLEYRFQYPKIYKKHTLPTPKQYLIVINYN